MLNIKYQRINFSLESTATFLVSQNLPVVCLLAWVLNNNQKIFLICGENIKTLIEMTTYVGSSYTYLLAALFIAI